MIRPMNIHTLILSLLLVATNAFGAAEKKQEVIGNVAADSALGKLLSVPGVDAIYKQCDKDNATQKDLVPKCIWDKVKLNDGLKKQVEAKYQEIVTTKPNPSGGRAPASAAKETPLTARNVNIDTDYNSDPGVKALSDFFGSKLAEVLHPENKDPKTNKFTVADHEKFISLYKTVLGKSLVNSLTAYCLNTDQSKCATDSAGNVTGACLYDVGQKKTNVDSLKNASFKDNSTQGQDWMRCISAVPTVCYEGALDNAGFDNDKTKESKKQACLVMDFVKASRKNIILADKQEAFYNELTTRNEVKMNVGNIQAIDDKKGTDEALTQISSSDLEKEYVGKDGKKTSVKNVNDGLAKAMESCIDKNDNIKNDANCKKYINTNAEENNKSVVEFALSQNIANDNLADKLNDDKNVAAYLKEEGYTKEQIDKMTEEQNIDKIRDDIKNRFKAEKDAIIAEMQAKVEKKTTDKNDDIQGSKNKLKTIKDQFSGRTEDLGQLIKFTNIVSSYLTIEDENAKKDPTKKQKVQRNTASLLAEVNTMKGADAEVMKQNIKDAGISADNKNNPKLTTEQINCAITKYKDQDKCK
jgi:hypothetical protein